MEVHLPISGYAPIIGLSMLLHLDNVEASLPLRRAVDEIAVLEERYVRVWRGQTTPRQSHFNRSAAAQTSLPVGRQIDTHNLHHPRFTPLDQESVTGLFFRSNTGMESP